MGGRHHVGLGGTWSTGAGKRYKRGRPDADVARRHVGLGGMWSACAEKGFKRGCSDAGVSDISTVVVGTNNVFYTTSCEVGQKIWVKHIG